METLLVKRQGRKGPAAAPIKLKPIKILYHHRTKSRDGQYIHIRSLIDAFRRVGHQVDEVGLTAGEGGDMGGESRFWKTLVKLIPAPLMELLEYIYSIPAAFWLWSRVRKNRPDLIYERYALGNFAGILASRWSGVPLFLEVNSPLALEKKATGHLYFHFLARWAERHILKRATRVLVVSQVLKEIYVKEGLDPEKIEVIHNGIDPAQYEKLTGDRFRKRHGLDGVTLIGFVGFIREWHRLDQVLHLVAEHLSEPKVKLLFVGDGPARVDLEKLVQTLNLQDKVIWTGTLNHKEIPEALAAIDIALQSEVTRYASPLKLFEYMAAGKAIAAPRRSNILEIVEEGRSALLFTPGEKDEMGDVLRRLVSCPDLRRQLGEGARRRLMDGGFTWDANARRIAKLLDRI